MAKKNKFFKLKYKIVEGKILMDNESFEHILTMLSAQKHINDRPVCGDLHISSCEFKKIQTEMQEDIDNCLAQGNDILRVLTMLNQQVV